ncbi:MAG: phosphatidylglycerophosphatase A [Candidatus Wallbacteria bacterium]|nr:phosphatidylglycerophosphatase A [Candidatus Wallbacteria bacterium]
MPDPFGTNFRRLGQAPPKKAEPEKFHPVGEFWIKLLASGFYSGYVPVAPGTAGTLVGVLLWWKLGRLPLDPMGKFVALTVATLIGVWISTMAEKVYNRGDANIIVIDEIVGFMVSAAYLTPGTYENEFRLVLVTFVIFRLLDIIKPFPIRQLEQLPQGWGVMADDIAAGVLTLLIMALPLNGLWKQLLDLQLRAGGK